MKIKCPICGVEYTESKVRFCKICMYSICSDPYLTNLLSHPSEEDLKVYNDSIAEYRTLWRERILENKRIDLGLVEMIEVEGGTFQMGSNHGDSDEKSVHQVIVGSFLIAKYVVTQELWEIVMGSNPSEFKASKRPVENVSWYDAVEFCNKLSEKEGLKKAYSGSGDNITCDFNADGYRLPTEAEWECAARGGNKSMGYEYSGSKSIDEVAWYSKNSESTHLVGKKHPNELGIYDMSGNVWEWCWDWYDGSYYNTGSHTNPKGAIAGSFRVLRGGSWIYDAVGCRVAFRGYGIPNGRGSGLGFRLVRTKN